MQYQVREMKSFISAFVFSLLQILHVDVFFTDIDGNENL
jgi:hypothetical protein